VRALAVKVLSSIRSKDVLPSKVVVTSHLLRGQWLTAKSPWKLFQGEI
jgi:hypothetical protein